MTKILIAESYDTAVLKQMIEEKGAELFFQEQASYDESKLNFVYLPNISVSGLQEQLQFYDAVMVRPKQVTAKAIQSSSKLKLIIRGGAGVNSIDVKSATEKSIIVENTPGLNSTATAEYSFALIFELLAKRNIYVSQKDTINGNMQDPLVYSGCELEGKKIAIVGMGNIGTRMAKIAEGFVMDVSYYNRSQKELHYRYHTSLEELASSQPDIVTLHIPLSLETTSIIGKEFFDRLKKGTILINTARAPLVNCQDFAVALGNGQLASAAIDGDYPDIKGFLEADKQNKCIITHHIADATFEAQQKITKQALTQVFAFFEEGKIINQVN